MPKVIIPYSEQSKQSEAVGEQVRFILNLFWCFKGWRYLFNDIKNVAVFNLI